MTFKLAMVGALMRQVVLVAICVTIAGCPARQPDYIKAVAAFEVPLPSEADRDQFLSVLRTAAQAEDMHVDAVSKGELEREAKLDPNFQMTMSAAVWRGSNDDESIASAMDQYDHLGRIWLVFHKGKYPEINARFRERAMHEIMLHWPNTLPLPIMSNGSIPLYKDLVRTPTSYVVRPSEAGRYGPTNTEEKQR